MKALGLPLVFLVISSLFIASSYGDQSQPNSDQNKSSIYIVSHKWHSGIVLPASALDLPIFSGARYVEVGWGDADYYPLLQTSVIDAFRAAFFSRGSVMHIVWFASQPSAYFPDSKVYEIRLTKQEMNRLIGFILNSFSYDERGRPVLIGKGLYGQSRFYKAQGDFHLLRNCNSWVAEALKSSEYPLSLEGVFTSDGLSKRLQREDKKR